MGVWGNVTLRLTSSVTATPLAPKSRPSAARGPRHLDTPAPLAEAHLNAPADRDAAPAETGIPPPASRRKQRHQPRRVHP